MTHPDTPGHAPVTRDPAELWVVFGPLITGHRQPFAVRTEDKSAAWLAAEGDGRSISRYISAAAHEAAIADAEQRGARAERERLDPKLAALVEAAKRWRESQTEDTCDLDSTRKALLDLGAAVDALEAP